MDLVKQALTTKYATFRGRARRKEYWLFILIIMIANIVLSYIDVAMGMMNEYGFGLLSGIFALAIFIPSLAISVRRLHDINKSGWWYLILLVPIVGMIALLVMFILPGTKGENRFGPDPIASDIPEPAAPAA